MSIILKRPDAEIKIMELSNGKREVTISSPNRWLSEKDRSIETHYPVELIETIFKVKGLYLNDEIRREEDPLYTKACLSNDILAYLPEKLAHYYACKFSKRVRKGESWNQLLRCGIRGSYPTEIFRILKKTESAFRPLLLKPCHLGFRDRIDVWYAGYAVSIANKYPKIKHIQRVLKYISKMIYIISGIVFLPTVSVALKKDF